QNRRVSQIWLAATDGHGVPWQFTTGTSSRNPRWAPDGRGIAFISARPEIAGSSASAARPQVYLLPMNGGEARRMTNFENGVEAFAWSPDGARLACISKVRDGSAPPNKSGSDVRHYLFPTYKFNDTG